MDELTAHLQTLLGMESKRALSVKMQQSGLTTDQICEILGVSTQFVSKWKLKYESGGVAILSPAYKGKPSYLSEEERAAVIAHLSKQESYSLDELVDYLQTHYQVRFKSKQSYYDLLAEGGLSWHKTQKRNPAKDEAAVLAKRAEIKKNWIRAKSKSEVGSSSS